MNNDFLASKKAGGTTTTGGSSSPFDQIAALEAREQARVQAELDAMAAEEQQVKHALQEKEVQAEQEMKDAAKQELLQYREEELSSIVKASEKEGDNTAATLEAAYAKKEPQLVQELVDKFLAYTTDTSA